MICDFCHHEFADGLTECPYCHKLVDIEAARMSREERDYYEGETIEVGEDGEVYHSDPAYQSGDAYDDANPYDQQDAAQPRPGFKVYHVGRTWLWLAVCLLILVASFFFLLPAAVILAAIGAAVYFFYSLFF